MGSCNLMTSNDILEIEQTQFERSLSVLLIVFMFAWLIAGMVAFIMSLYCFGKSGEFSYKIFGFLLAVLFGPFYWLYYGFMGKKYCQ